MLRHDSLQLSGSPACRPAASAASVDDAGGDACDASGLAFAALLGQGGRQWGVFPRKAGEQSMRRVQDIAWPVVGLGAVALSSWLLFRELRGLSYASLRDAFSAISGPRWVMAFGSTALAYAALAWYDRIGLLHLGRKISWLFVGADVVRHLRHRAQPRRFGLFRRAHPLSRLFDPGPEHGGGRAARRFLLLYLRPGRGDARRRPAALPARSHRALRRRAGLGRAGGRRGPDRRALPLYPRIVASFPGGQGRRASR